MSKKTPLIQERAASVKPPKKAGNYHRKPVVLVDNLFLGHEIPEYLKSKYYRSGEAVHNLSFEVRHTKDEIAANIYTHSKIQTFDFLDILGMKQLGDFPYISTGKNHNERQFIVYDRDIYKNVETGDEEIPHNLHPQFYADQKLKEDLDFFRDFGLKPYWRKSLDKPSYQIMILLEKALNSSDPRYLHYKKYMNNLPHGDKGYTGWICSNPFANKACQKNKRWICSGNGEPVSIEQMDKFTDYTAPVQKTRAIVLTRRQLTEKQKKHKKRVHDYAIKNAPDANDENVVLNSVAAVLNYAKKQVLMQTRFISKVQYLVVDGEVNSRECWSFYACIHLFDIYRCILKGMSVPEAKAFLFPKLKEISDALIEIIKPTIPVEHHCSLLDRELYAIIGVCKKYLDEKRLYCHSSFARQLSAFSRWLTVQENSLTVLKIKSTSSTKKEVLARIMLYLDCSESTARRYYNNVKLIYNYFASVSPYFFSFITDNNSTVHLDCILDNFLDYIQELTPKLQL